MPRLTKYQRWKEEGKCVNCGCRPKEIGLLCTKCSVVRKKAVNRCRLNVKKEVISHYGGKCACCGETELSFLTLDHINGDGKQHRLSLNTGCGTDFYQAMKRLGFPDGLQVLCANCHLSKTVLGQCIHRKDVENG